MMTKGGSLPILRQGQILLLRLFYRINVDFSESIAASDVKNGRCRQLKEDMKVVHSAVYIFYFWSFEISRNILRNQKIL